MIPHTDYMKRGWEYGCWAHGTWPTRTRLLAWLMKVRHRLALPREIHTPDWIAPRNIGDAARDILHDVERLQRAERRARATAPINPGVPPFLLAGQHPAERVYNHQAIGLDIYLHGDPKPTRNQVAAVLHALADHTHNAHMLGPEVVALGRDRGGSGTFQMEVTGLGRYFHALGDALETFDEVPAGTGPRSMLNSLATTTPDPKGP